jgi:hypothetical protein
MVAGDGRLNEVHKQHVALSITSIETDHPRCARLLLPNLFAPPPRPPACPPREPPRPPPRPRPRSPPRPPPRPPRAPPGPPRPPLDEPPSKSSVDALVFCFDRLPAPPKPNLPSRAVRGMRDLSPGFERLAGRSAIASSTAMSKPSPSASALSRPPLRSALRVSRCTSIANRGAHSA